MVHRRGRGRPPHPDVLTPTEWTVLDLVRHGMSRRTIAQRRGVSLDAVKYHVQNIAGKLGVRGVAELRQWPGFPATSRLNERKGQPMTTETQRLVLERIGQVSLYIRDVGARGGLLRRGAGPAARIHLRRSRLLRLRRNADLPAPRRRGEMARRLNPLFCRARDSGRARGAARQGASASRARHT